jgi:hypothetical protein
MELYLVSSLHRRSLNRVVQIWTEHPTQRDGARSWSTVALTRVAFLPPGSWYGYRSGTTNHPSIPGTSFPSTRFISSIGADQPGGVPAIHPLPSLTILSVCIHFPLAQAALPLLSINIPPFFTAFFTNLLTFSALMLSQDPYASDAVII